MKKKFVCIFPYLKDTHLIQGIGQIGNYFAEMASIQPVVVCYGESEFPSLKTEAKNQSIFRLKNKGMFLFFEKAILIYIIKEAKRIDFLHVQHLNKADIYLVLIYKLINPKGKIFLKLDINLPEFEKGVIYSKVKLFDAFHKIFERIALRKIDLIAADSNGIFSSYKTQYPYVKDKLIVLSQNLNDQFLNEKFPKRKTFEEKENIILTTGRIGAQDKNYELLLETLPLVDLQDWKVIFVGEIYNDFDKKVEKLLLDYPELNAKVEITGLILDRVALYNYYDRAKIFCLTSVLESFGVSFIEALYFDNYIIGTTGMSSFDDISDNEGLGEKVPVNDKERLAACLNKLIKNQRGLSNLGLRANDYVASRYFLSKNIQPLKRLLY